VRQCAEDERVAGRSERYLRRDTRPLTTTVRLRNGALTIMRGFVPDSVLPTRCGVAPAKALCRCMCMVRRCCYGFALFVLGNLDDLPRRIAAIPRHSRGKAVYRGGRILASYLGVVLQQHMWTLS